ncbi:hypothetical protein ACYJ1Y_14020 [Natrialbaceae archaeon A-gly3]
MTNPVESEETGPVVTLESLPPESLSMSQLESLEETDAIEIAAPLVIDTTTSRVTHFDLVLDDTHYYLGWNPTENQWERMLVVEDTEEELVVESAITVYDDESGEIVVGFDPHDDPEVEDFIDFVWKYVEYTFPETNYLYNVMDDALEELSADDS